MQIALPMCAKQSKSSCVFFFRFSEYPSNLGVAGFPGSLKRHGFWIFISSVGVQMDDSEILGDSAGGEPLKTRSLLGWNTQLISRNHPPKEVSWNWGNSWSQAFGGAGKALMSRPQKARVSISLFHSYPDSYPCNMIKSWLSCFQKRNSFQWLCSSMFQ